MEKKLKLTNGGFTLLDEEDWEYLSQYKCWRVMTAGGAAGPYAKTRIDNGDVYVHREILSAEKGQQVDHVNGDGLDNRRSNLRICSYSENLQNKRRNKNNASGYKGVSWHNQMRKWQATIAVNGKHCTIGCFANPREAAIAYNIAAVEFFGTFSRLNGLGNDPRSPDYTFENLVTPRPSGIDKALERIRRQLNAR